MLTREENERLTRVGPGTAAGELLRRYWYPVGVATELTEETPTQLVRILGETLVLFRDKKGRVGLLDDRCAHRGASLCYGRVEERGIACPYHGWLVRHEGKLPGDAGRTVRQQVSFDRKAEVLSSTKAGRPLLGLFGPGAGAADHRISMCGLERMDIEKSLFNLSSTAIGSKRWKIPWIRRICRFSTKTPPGAGEPIKNTTRGLTDDVEKFEFYEVPYGLMKRRTYKNGMLDEHPVIFPNILRQGNVGQIRVPMDDTHTKIYFVRFFPTEDGSVVENDEPPVEYIKPYKNPPDALHPYTKFRMDAVQAQDHMAWETQGPIADRTRERLTSSDRGIVLLREVMMREMKRVQQGLDPMGVIRDPSQNPMIDTHLMESIAQVSGSRAPRAVNE